MTIRVRVGDDPVQAADLAWTVTDPGGYESASFRLESGQIPRPGTDVLITDGLSVCFDGFVEEPGRRLERGREAGSVNCRGRRFELDRNPYSMVYMDRGVGAWSGPGRARNISLLSTLRVGQGGSLSDPTSGAPAVETKFSGPFGGSIIAEAWYDAGVGNDIGELRATWTRGPQVDPGDAQYTWQAFLASDDGAAVSDPSGNLRATGPGTTAVRASGPRRFAGFQQTYGTTGGLDGLDYNILWTDVRVIGDHGLTIRGDTAATQGVYPQDIFRHAHGKSGARFATRITDQTAYILQHGAYREPVPPSQIQGDMARILGWHWGVWEPENIFSRIPTLHLSPPPPTATVSVRYRDCQQAEFVERLSQMHDRIIATISDPAGSAGVVTINRSHPRLPTGVTGQAILTGIGTTTEAAGTQIAQALLLLDQLQGTMAGTATLPSITLDGRPTHLLRPGRDRIEMLELPSTGNLLADTLGRPSAARIKRLSVRVQDGVPVSSIDFDAGADLVETLNARLAVASVLAGA